MIKASVFQKQYPNDLGSVRFRISPNATRITIYLNAKGHISVSIPRRCTFREAEDFLLSKQHDIVAKRNKISQRARNTNIEFPVRTKLYELHLLAGQQFGTSRNGNTFTLEYPSRFNPQSTEVQQYAKITLTELYRSEARQLLPPRVAELANLHGFTYNRVSIRATHTRWGSCAHNNNISLSLNLMRLPNHLIDYVILHELCHTVVKNHSSDFWQLLNTTCNGKAKALDKEIKQWASTI
ncbi:MAG: M48 family metallopeptidase [Bacteroidales bacterium]|nr:M48 family metallopeptidase [Bacteroidales bacterium]